MSGMNNKPSNKTNFKARYTWDVSEVLFSGPKEDGAYGKSVTHKVKLPKGTPQRKGFKVGK